MSKAETLLVDDKSLPPKVEKPNQISEMAKRTSKINTWKPRESQKYVVPDGRLFICYFEKLFDLEQFMKETTKSTLSKVEKRKRLKEFDTFIINKGSYENQLPIITKYINFFMNYYDAEGTLPVAYFKLKYELDYQKRYNIENMNAFIDMIYEILFTPDMVEKINQMIEENYLDDIESDTEEKKKYMKNEKKHLESLEFTNQHIKILLRISFGMKLMSPLLFHYLAINIYKIEKDDDVIFRFYHKLFTIFGYGNDYERFDKDGNLLERGIDKSVIDDALKNGTVTKTTEDGRVYKYYLESGDYYTLTKIDMYNKLYVYVKAKVLESNSNNAPIFEQREIFGTDVFTVINQFVKKVLISENIVKYKFNEHWDPKQKKYKENVIGFNKTIIKFQLNYFLKDQYQKNLTEVTNAKNSDGLSGIDKMAMNLTKLNEGTTILVDINKEETMKDIKKKFDVPISDEEIEYYIKNLSLSKLQIEFIDSFFAKYFGAYRDMNLLTKREHITLAVILKKKLLLELGYDTETGDIHQAALPYILTGNLEDRVNNRVIRNNRFINKIDESYLYEKLKNSKYKYLVQIKPDIILEKLSTFINTRFTYVTYENPELLGEEIVYSEDKISDELLFFLNSL